MISKLDVNWLDDVYNLFMKGEVNWTRSHLHYALTADKYSFFADIKHSAPRCVICYQIVESEAELQNIVTDERFRNSGLATQIIEYTMTYVRDQAVESVYLEVSTANVPALKLYESFGFQKVGLRKRYYQDGSDAFQMEKKLV